MDEDSATQGSLEAKAASRRPGQRHGALPPKGAGIRLADGTPWAMRPMKT